MDFYELVDQVVILLQQRGKLTYRSLRRQFDLDDEALDDLKDELLFSHPVADDEDRGLVWTGDAAQGLTPTTGRSTPCGCRRLCMNGCKGCLSYMGGTFALDGVAYKPDVSSSIISPARACPHKHAPGRPGLQLTDTDGC